MSDCDCKHDDPLDCEAAKTEELIEDLLAAGSNGCDCSCHEEPA